MSFLFRRAFGRARDGSYAVRLSDDERRLLSELPGMLAALVESDPDDPWLKRLFPTAYPNDPDREQEWRLLMSVDLHDRRQAQLAALAETAGATTLTEEQLLVWTQALNDLRLYVGTRLEISEETEPGDFEDEEDRDLFLLYDWLTSLQGQAIDALGDPTDDPGQGDSAG